MKGDFSRLDGDRAQVVMQNNFCGVLHQQGRVLLDNDWNTQTVITTNWQDQAGKDIFGPSIAAIPANEVKNFKIQARTINIESDQICFDITAGRIWADGLLLYLGQPGEVLARTATAVYPKPPSTEGAEQYLILLEIWRNVINGYQLPDLLLDPALGGTDTTERLQTEFAFRFLNLPIEDMTCPDMLDLIKTNLLSMNKGKLTVTLASDVEAVDDTSVVALGGYQGLEPRLYRIEIAATNLKARNEPMFKWSRCNGCLVGRGVFKQNQEIVITANLQAIKQTHQQRFYMEIIQYNDHLGIWETTYGANVQLDNDRLNIIQNAVFLNLDREPEKTVFFRLWNGILRINDYLEPRLLDAGIFLQFDATEGEVFRPEDYWTFPMRIKNQIGELNHLLPKKKVPDGIKYHLVPLAVFSKTEKRIEVVDCRKLFLPLTDLFSETVRHYHEVIAGTERKKGSLVDQKGKTNLKSKIMRLLRKTD